MPATERVSPGTTEARRLRPGVLELVFVGHMTGKAMEAAVAVLEAAEKEALRVVIFDATRISSFESSVRGPGGVLLSTTKRFGAVGIAAIKSTPVRMMAVTVAFATGLPLRIVGSVEEAYQLAETELSSRR
jgi:hypothetical protein